MGQETDGGSRSEGDAGDPLAGLRWPTAAQSAAATARREELLAQLDGRVRWCAGGTKVDCTALSPGCQVCVAGGWSCLFVNGRCNTRCFYCPDRQTEVGVPVTNALRFPSPGEYVAYLERFGFAGVSISGGEPLLTLDRTLGFLRAVKRRLGGAVHTWLYTNGILLTAETAARLRDAGLSEVRVDIAATGYRLDAVRAAAGVIGCVTVEVPAVPEDLAARPDLVHRLADAGVNFLNLHQLKVTPHNRAALLGRGYSFLPTDQPTVLESELAALETLARAVREDAGLPVNYCSWVYKHRYQRAAARRRAAAVVRRPGEDTAPSGLLRRLSLRGATEQVAAVARHLRRQEAPAELWAVADNGTRLCFAASLWDAVDPAGRGQAVHVAHVLPRLVDAVTYRHPFVEIPLGRKRRVAVERAPAGEELVVGREDLPALRALVQGTPPAHSGTSRTDPAPGTPLARFLALDRLEEGLLSYDDPESTQGCQGVAPGLLSEQGPRQGFPGASQGSRSPETLTVDSVRS